MRGVELLESRIRQQRELSNEHEWESDWEEEGTFMELYFWAIFGGLLGTGLMDLAGSFAERLRIVSGGS